jgi:putative transposase
VSRPLRLEFPGAIWHVTSRGNERRDIYRDDRDRRCFLNFLGDVVVERRWLLHAWVLMSNHYHLLIETPGVGLSRGLKWLNQQYAEMFNARYERVGHLFQGRFKGILVEREGHLLELLRYIVLNPVRCSAVSSADEYAWSNYRATAGLVPPPSWLAVDWTLNQFGADRERAIGAYRRFVAEAGSASYRPWDGVAGRNCLGDDAFQERVQAIVDSRERSSEHPRSQRMLVSPRFDSIVELVCERYGVTVGELRTKKRREARKVLCYLATEDAGLTLRAVAAWLEMTESAASQMRSAARTLIAEDESLREMIRLIRAALT